MSSRFSSTFSVPKACRLVEGLAVDTSAVHACCPCSLVFTGSIGRVDRWRAHLLAGVGWLRSLVQPISTNVASPTLRRPGKGVGLIDFLDRGYEYLRTRLNVLLTQRLIHVLKLIEPIMAHWLAVRASRPVCIVEKQLVDHTLILHSKLRSHDVLFDLPAEIS